MELVIPAMDVAVRDMRRSQAVRLPRLGELVAKLQWCAVEELFCEASLAELVALGEVRRRWRRWRRHGCSS
jgi:hypothetical protein